MVDDVASDIKAYVVEHVEPKANTEERSQEISEISESGAMCLDSIVRKPHLPARVSSTTTS